jgi:hypothetical protein
MRQWHSAPIFRAATGRISGPGCEPRGDFRLHLSDRQVQASRCLSLKHTHGIWKPVRLRCSRTVWVMRDTSACRSRAVARLRSHCGPSQREVRSYSGTTVPIYPAPSHPRQIMSRTIRAAIPAGRVCSAKNKALFESRRLLPRRSTPATPPAARVTPQPTQNSKKGFLRCPGACFTGSLGGFWACSSRILSNQHSS